MNIFVLDLDPEKAAQSLHDVHLVKMILESAQILTAVSHRYGHPTLYKVTHKNHPSTLWAGERHANWNWLINHSLAMNEEKIKRTGKSHASAEVIRYYQKNQFGPPIDNLPMTPFALAMPDEFKTSDPVQSYRNYYLKRKQFFKNGKRPTWTNTQPPAWWQYL